MAADSEQVPEGSPASMDREVMGQSLARFLEGAGLGAAAAGEAPGKTAEAWADHLLAGYSRDALQLLQPTWEDSGGQLVSITAIPFVSVCAHHLLPFFGTAHVAYMPKGRILGLSKLARIVDMYARRLQVQERLTTEVGQAVESVLAPAGVAVTMQANHLCMAMRGVEKPGATTMTTFRSGVFRETDRWDEFQGLVRG